MSRPLLVFVLCSLFVAVTLGSTPIPYMVGYTTKDNPSDAQTIAGWLGRPLDILGTTITMTAYWTSISAPFKISVAVPMLSIDGWNDGTMTDMSAAATGAYDSYYQGQASSLASATGTLHAVRLGWEMNGNWYPWSVNGTGGTNQNHANYIATFQRMATIFRNTVPGVQIEFCMNWGYEAAGYGLSGTPDLYWPGDQYVDIVSLDIYQADLGNEWDYAVSGGTYNLNWLTSFAATHNVKIAISEWGAANDDASYITDAIAWMNSLGDNFTYSVYSQYSPADQVVTAGSNPNEQAAWIAGWGNTYYSPPQNRTSSSSSSSTSSSTSSRSSPTTSRSSPTTSRLSSTTASSKTSPASSSAKLLVSVLYVTFFVGLCLLW